MSQAILSKVLTNAMIAGARLAIQQKEREQQAMAEILEKQTTDSRRRFPAPRAALQNGDE